jgi:hypothetical protein
MSSAPKSICRRSITAAAALACVVGMCIFNQRAHGEDLVPIRGVSEDDQPRATDQAARLTKDELLVAVRGLRSQIEDFSVQYTDKSLLGSPGEIKDLDHRLITKGNVLFYTETSYVVGTAKNPKPIRSVVSFNGQQVTRFLMNRSVAQIDESRDANNTLKDLFILEGNLIAPPSPKGSGYDDLNLESALASPSATVHSKMESIGTFECYVVDVASKRSDQLEMRTFLAENYGFVPVRTIYFSHNVDHTKMIEVNALQITSVQGKFWFATHLMRHYFPSNNGLPEGRVEVSTKIKDGKCAIGVNTGVSDEFFDAWKRLPPGTVLNDSSKGTMTTVQGTDLKKVGENIKASTDSLPLSIPERVGATESTVPSVARPLASQATSSFGWLSSTLVVGAGLGIIGILILYMRKTANDQSPTRGSQ